MSREAFFSSLSATQCYHSDIKRRQALSRYQDTLYCVPPSKFNSHRNRSMLIFQHPQMYPSVLLTLLCFRLQDLDGCISGFSPPLNAVLLLTFPIIKTSALHSIQELSKHKTHFTVNFQLNNNPQIYIHSVGMTSST